MRVLGHPLHQLLIVFPVGLLLTTLAFDMIGLLTDDVDWWHVAYRTLQAGLIGGLVAAVFGYMDWRNIRPGTRAKRVGLTHALGNVLVLALAGWSLLLRESPDLTPGLGAIALIWVVAILLGVTGWLGAELIVRLGVGVHPTANVEAGTSLRDHGLVEADTSFSKQ